MIDLSVLIPVRDEENNIEELVERLMATLTNLKITYEILFITDINRDNTFEVLKDLSERDDRIKIIKLSNSFGQHIAVVAGLNLCVGQAVVIMDGDLQDYPEDIPKLYIKMLEGYDIVYGIKEKKNDSLFRNIYSKMFISILNKLSDTKMEYNTSMFRIISRKTANAILEFKEREPSLTFIMSLIGFKSTTVEVTSGIRKKGITKYNFFKLLNFAINSLLSFSTKPIRIISVIGFCISGLSLIYLCVVLIQSLFLKVGVLGWPTIVALITFLGGAQLFSMGIIGEYIGRIFIETKKRPLYTIDEKVGIFE